MAERYTVVIVYWAMWMLLGWGGFFVFGFVLGRRRGARLVDAAARSHDRILTKEDMDVQRESLRNYDFEKGGAK